MVEQSDPAPDLDGVFAALGDVTRRGILAQLASGEARISDLAEPLPISFEAVSKHVRVLERAGLVRREVRGREHYLELVGWPLAGARDWLDHYRIFWEERLDALAVLVAERRRTSRTSTSNRTSGGEPKWPKSRKPPSPRR
jgi:DNA-binding transcriptional ArsR family regulator